MGRLLARRIEQAAAESDVSDVGSVLEPYECAAEPCEREAAAPASWLDLVSSP